MPAEPTESLLSRLTPQLRRVALGSTYSEVRQSADDLLNDLFLKLSVDPPPEANDAELHTIRAFRYLVKSLERSVHRRIHRERAVAVVPGILRRTCNPHRFGDVGLKGSRSEKLEDGSDSRILRHETRWHVKRAMRTAKIRPDHCCAFWAWVRSTVLPSPSAAASRTDPLEAFARRRGIPISTARVWAIRARKSLRPYLEHLWDGDPAVGTHNNRLKQGVAPT